MRGSGGDSIYCSICEKEVDVRREMKINHDCGCFSHTRCHSVDSDFSCARCQPVGKAASFKPAFEEPNNYPDIDWVTCNTRDVQTRVTQARVTLNKLLAIGASHTQETENPLTLLQRKISLETIMRRRNWSLADLYFRGITLDHLLQNGYSLDDLKNVSKDVRDRPLATLRRLGLTPDHLVEYKIPVMFQPKDVASKETGGGMGYNPKTKCICTAASGAIWNVDELIHLGFVFDDLVAIGVNTRERWSSLGKMSREQLTKLGARPVDISGLPHEFPEEDEEEPPVPMDEEEEEEEHLVPAEIELPVQQAVKIQKAANALYLQPKRRLLK